MMAIFDDDAAISKSVAQDFLAGLGHRSTGFTSPEDKNMAKIVKRQCDISAHELSFAALQMRCHGSMRVNRL